MIHMSTSRTKTPRILAALAGVLSVALGVGLGELLSAWLTPSISPVTAIGGVVIDNVPPGVKDFAIATFGTADKLALIVGMGIIIAIFAAAAGILQYSRPPVGVAIIAVFGLLGLGASLLRPGTTPIAVTMPLVVALVAILALRFLIARLRAFQPASPRDSTKNDGDASLAGSARRTFLVGSLVAAAGAIVAGSVSVAVRSSRAAFDAVRQAITLPKPVKAAPPEVESLEVEGITPWVVPNKDFYRIDTALTVPEINPETWELRVTGMVDREVSMTFQELLAKPMVEDYVTLTCVSNYVGGDLVGNAKWLGWPIRELLGQAGVQDGADMVLSRSVDGFTASTPLEILTDKNRNALIAVGMNGGPLPPEHGFPARMVVPGLYGYVSATKWVTELKVTTFARDKAYWSTRGYSERAPIKQSSRMDTPKPGQPVAAGEVWLGGVAWAQPVGVKQVQVKIDGDDWKDATIGDATSGATWVQWALKANLDSGAHTIKVRSVNRDGEVQTEERADVVPDGATGIQSTVISVT